MNERIRQLWDQAAKLESDPSWEGQTRFMERFAQLVVQECSDHVMASSDRYRKEYFAERVLETFRCKNTE